jgi:hypothetical protein
MSRSEKLRVETRDVDFLKREYEHKLAQEKAMHAQADAEAARAELEAVRESLAEPAPATDANVAYERADAVADYEFAVAGFEDLSEELRKAI